VTGHQDVRPADRAALEERVREALRELADRHPSTRLVLLSPLAEGADRLAARAALDLGIDLVVPLPMPAEAYERTFGNVGGPGAEASVAEFRDLLARASRSFVLDDGPGEAGGGPRDDLRYARLGAYLCRSCHALIALWDGTPSGPTGGTADVVRYRLEGIPPEYDPGHSWLEAPETGPVCHVVTPRAAGPRPPDAFSRVDRFPDGLEGQAGARVAWERAGRLIDRLNGDALALDDPEAVAASRRGLLPEPEAAGLPPDAAAIRERFAVVDALAARFRGRTLATLGALLALGLVVSILFQAHIWSRGRPSGAGGTGPFRTTYDAVYLGAFACLFAVFHRARRKAEQARHLDYRALAEGLRVQFFWRLAGMPDGVADHYLRKQRGELAWIRSALRAGDILDDAAPDRAGPVAPRFDQVLRHWVDEQVLYLVGRTGLDGRKQRQLRPVATLLGVLNGSTPPGDVVGAARALGNDRASRLYRFLADVVLCVALMAFAAARGLARPEHWAVIALGLAVSVLALAGFYARVMAFAEHAKQYGRAGTIFAHARRRLDDLLSRGGTDPAEVRSLLRELGREAIAEAGDWLLLHRDRPLELPKT
jgi:hypothetical protein